MFCTPALLCQALCGVLGLCTEACCACRYDIPAEQLQFVPDELWKSKQMQSWTNKDIQFVLDSAESLLTDCASSLRVPVSVRFVCTPCMFMAPCLPPTCALSMSLAVSTVHGPPQCMPCRLGSVGARRGLVAATTVALLVHRQHVITAAAPCVVPQQTSQ